MNIRELPWTDGRFFEVDSWNVILQPEPKFIYLLLTCQCPNHEMPTLHIPSAVTAFIPSKKYLSIAPYSPKWIHVIENNKEGFIFYKSLAAKQQALNDCQSLKICSTI